MMTTSQLFASDWSAALLNHLWQSTAVAIVAWMLTLALRNNSARVRHSIWLVASIKFLLPFQVLAFVGTRWSRPVSSSNTHLYTIVEEFTRPIRQAPIDPVQAVSSGSPAHLLSLVWAFVGAVWLCGFIVLLLKWTAGWNIASGMARAAKPVKSGREFDALANTQSSAGLQRPIPLLLSSGGMEPGIFGIVRPVLLWPTGLSDKLSDMQVEAIMAHEVEHVRRRDNLTSAIHSFVEAIFWFHPLVRWMSTRLTEERERACDERVLEQNSRPEAYAESILKVCSFCMEPATACVSGVSGADLKQRILRIMTRPSGTALGMGRKCLLFGVALFTVAAPVGFGVLHGQSGSISSGPSQASAATTDIPKFDVATIKPSTEEDGRVRMMMIPDGISLRGVPPGMLIQSGFGVERDRIVGAPDWVRSKRFDIEAKVAPDDAAKLDKLNVEQRRAMILPLLEERFGLKYNHEIR